MTNAKAIPDFGQFGGFAPERLAKTGARRGDTIEQCIGLHALVGPRLQRLQPLKRIPQLFQRIAAVVGLWRENPLSCGFK